MKKISLTLATAGLAASLGAYAAVPTDAQPFQLVVPNLQSGIEITLEGLYLRPSNSDLDYATVNTFASDLFSDAIFTSNSNIQTVDPDYNFGFRVGLGYIFPDSGNDVQAAWTHFSHTDSDTTNSPSGLSLLTSPLGNITVVDTTLTDLERFIALGFGLPIYENATVTSDVKFKLDSVDLNVGQYMDIGTRLRMRMFGGLRFAQVTNDQTSTTNASGFGSFEFTVGDDDALLTVDYANTVVEQFNSKFTGIGPQVGVDTSYHIGNCFGVAAHAAMGLLVGNVESNTTSNDVFTLTETLFIDGDFIGSETFTDTDNLNINSDDVTRIVPVFDAKLGLNWSYIFSNQSVLTLEGGYQWTQYIDAVDKLTLDDSFNTERTTSSVGFDGPYLTLNWSV